METRTEAGTAYGFFYCEASKDKIETEIPSLKKAGNIPNLEVTLFDHFQAVREEVKEAITGLRIVDRDEDPTGIEAIFQSASENNLDYVLRGYLAEGTNLGAARQVSHLLMQMNQSYLNKLGEIWGNVVYREDDGRFVFL